MRLSREMMFAGMDWYRKEVAIPESWKGQNIRLMMELTYKMGNRFQKWSEFAPALY